MRNARFTAQIVVLVLQIYFFVQTLLLHTTGSAVFPFKPIGDGWTSMKFTLMVVLFCEIFALADAILALLSRRSIYGFAYLALLLINAYLFRTMAYYSTAGTVVCMILYTVLFVLRINRMIAHFVSDPYL